MIQYVRQYFAFEISADIKVTYALSIATLPQAEGEIHVSVKHSSSYDVLLYTDGSHTLVCIALLFHLSKQFPAAFE